MRLYSTLILTKNSDMKTILTISIMFFFAICLQAQSYNFSVGKRNYEKLQESTLLINEPLWDDPEFNIPLEIEFTFFDQKLEYLYCDDDGALYSDSIRWDSYDGIVPFGADLMDRSNDFNFGSQANSLSNISYVVQGEVGTRVQKIEWDNVGFYLDIEQDGVSTDFVNFQLWLYEETGTIEIHFGEMSVSNPDLVFEDLSGPLIGLFNEFDEDTETVGEFIYLIGDPQNPIYESSTVLDYYDFNTIVGTPTNGTVYRFERGSVAVNNVAPVQDKYILSPNPATDILSIGQNIDQSKIQAIKIYNTNGQLIQTKAADSNTLNISSLPAGVFYLHIQDKDELSVQRFVKLDK